jgi:alcohol dehydrogenase class IV
MSTQIILPRILQVGVNASAEIGQVMQQLGCKKPLIITDKMMVQLGYSAPLVNALQAVGISAQVFSDTLPEPTVASIQAGVMAACEGEFDAIIALGGGSPIDSAKAIAILAKYGGQMRDYKFPRIVSERGLPVVAIPTTAGTGSEVTKVTIITDEVSGEKMLCMGTGFMPQAALIDYALTLSLPARVSADTGIDALTHAMEAYVSKKASLFTDGQAINAIKLLAPNLRKVYHDGQDTQAREQMMLGSTLAGIAFSNASVALVHGMSRPIGAAFHVPHGLSNAMLLPEVTRFSLSGASARYADCARAMGIATAADTDAQAGVKLIDELYAINDELQVPSPAQFGIDRGVYFSSLTNMAQQALASGSPGNNPREASVEQMIEIYRTVYE